MATGALNNRGIWIYGEDDSEATFSALLNKLGNSVSSAPGQIIQVKSNSTTSYLSTTSDTFQDAGMSVSITPTSTTSKIFVFVSFNGGTFGTGALNGSIYRNTTNLNAGGFGYIGTNAALGTIVGTYLDSPATTSATTYKGVYRSTVAGQGVYANNNVLGTITVMEVSV